MLTVVVFSATQAAAFRIGAHEQMTARACALDAARYPELRRYAKVLVDGNAWEDKNVLLKWLRYNHFYKPTEKVRTLWRKTSDARVKALWAEVQQAARAGKLRKAFNRAGHLLHHIQDMASPPHVVPVNHGLLDGFEGYHVGRLIERATGPPIANLSGVTAHHELALDTYRAVNSGGLSVAGRSIPWTSFWKERRGRFGSYGVAGNSFGKKEIAIGSARYVPDPVQFHRFIRDRVEAAVGYSRAFLRWAVERIRALRPGLSTRSGGPPKR